MSTFSSKAWRTSVGAFCTASVISAIWVSDSSLTGRLAKISLAWLAVSVWSVSGARATDRAWVGVTSLRTAGSVV
jgi:hypothetical protein